MKIRPEHFDWLGFACFLFILGCGLYILNTGRLPSWAIWLLIVIGIGGAAVDGTIVYRYFIRKD